MCSSDLDGVSSPCLNRGNPGDDYTLEPDPDGDRINLGAYEIGRASCRERV